MLVPFGGDADTRGEEMGVPLTAVLGLCSLPEHPLEAGKSPELTGRAVAEETGEECPGESERCERVLGVR